MNVLSSVLLLIGGLAFFLFGMSVMSGSLEKMAGGKLENSLKKVTTNPIISIILGAAITIAVQSSSASTVMLVGLVNSGIMTLSQTIYIVFGANIGTTLTSWIMSLAGIQSDNVFVAMLKPENFAPVFALIGVFMIMLAKKDKNKSIGTVFVGFAVLMYGMTMMGDAVAPLADLPQFSTALVTFTNPLVGLIVGTLFTALIQSSAASIGILQSLAMTGQIPIGMTLPIIMGQNIGTCITALISSIGTEKEAKRVAYMHIFINVLGTVICLVPYVILDSIFNFALVDAPATPFTVAIGHTIFNVVTTVVLAPFSKQFIKFIEFISPDKKGIAANKQSDSPMFLDERLLRSPSIAIAEVNSISKRMCKLSRDTVFEAVDIMSKFDKKMVDKVLHQEDEIDKYEDKLGTYLVKLSTQSVSRNDSRLISKMLHAIGDFERLSDHAVNIAYVAEEIHSKKLKFSPEAQKEIKNLTEAVTEIISITTAAYVENDLDLAATVEPLEEVIDNITAKIKTNHIERLQKGVCTIEMGFILSDLLTNLERISDHCSNIAIAIIEVENDTFDAHAYVSGVKFGSIEFNQVYDGYMEKYGI